MACMLLCVGGVSHDLSFCFLSCGPVAVASVDVCVCVCCVVVCVWVCCVVMFVLLCVLVLCCVLWFFVWRWFVFRLVTQLCCLCLCVCVVCVCVCVCVL